MWPEQVERVAQLLRRAGIEGALEELPAGVDGPPGVLLRALGFDCAGRPLVALVPADREVDRDKLASALRCPTLRDRDADTFPYRGKRVVIDRSALTAGQVWVEAGSPRHVLGIAPAPLVRLVRAETADLLLED